MKIVKLCYVYFKNERRNASLVERHSHYQWLHPVAHHGQTQAESMLIDASKLNCNLQHGVIDRISYAKPSSISTHIDQ